MPSSVNFWVGLDVHKDSVTAAVFRNRDPEPQRVDRLPYDLHKIRRYFQRLQKEDNARACYEASGAGYVLQRALLAWGVECELAAPSLIPRRPGEHRKTDRRDAIKIGRDFRDDRLVLIHVPTEEDERIRDLVRCRETFQREIIKSRHYILKFMRRRGFIFREGDHWTLRHMTWIRQVLAPGTLADEDHVVLSEYLALLEYKLQRRDELDGRIEALALTPRYKPVVDRIRCFRGFKTQAAMVIATELGDVRRFENPRQLMAYVGLVPSEHSSGDRRRLGSITKAGNARVRHILIQAAWQYRRRPTVEAPLRQRQRGQDPSVIGHAWKCQHRLYTLFHRLAVKKPRPVAATAAARELVGFLWAILRDMDVSRLQEVSAAA
ncbi:MAG TPA: IS110 family transposase [Thermoleophilia bacterium]|nr:IS110 family transposase [Thermoleophilia bacterium]